MFLGVTTPLAKSDTPPPRKWYTFSWSTCRDECLDGSLEPFCFTRKIDTFWNMHWDREWYIFSWSSRQDEFNEIWLDVPGYNFFVKFFHGDCNTKCHIPFNSARQGGCLDGWHDHFRIKRNGMDFSNFNLGPPIVPYTVGLYSSSRVERGVTRHVSGSLYASDKSKLFQGHR